MEWISVEDRLPDIGNEVLIFCQGIGYTGKSYSYIWISHRKTSDFDEGYIIEWDAFEQDITHWMPLPKPPN